MRRSKGDLAHGIEQLSLGGRGAGGTIEGPGPAICRHLRQSRVGIDAEDDAVTALRLEAGVIEILARI